MADGRLADIDPNVLELLERRISERVAENVERTLKWRYGVVLAVFTAVAALFGWSVKTTFDSQIQKLTLEAEGLVKQATATAKADADREIERLAEKTSEASRQADVSFGIADNVRQRVSTTMDEVDKRVDQFDGKLRALDELGGRIDAAGQRLVDLTAQLDAAKQRRGEEIEDRLRPINQNLASLAQQIGDLQGLVLAAGPDVAPSPADPAFAKVRQEVAAIAAQSNLRVEQTAKPADVKATVYFQFAGGTRQQAQQISAILKESGFQVPGEERNGGAATQHEVRYFHTDDEPAAGTLAATVNMAAAKLGYPIRDVVVNPFTTYAGTKPRPGTVELWLEIPAPAKSAQAAP